MANPYFNAVYYLQQNPDVFSAGYTVATAWDHYVKHGANEANVVGGTFRAPNPWFDVKYYLANNPDLVRAGITPATALDHFLNYGSKTAEDRAPNATIAAAPITEAKLLTYVKANADLQTAFGIAAGATTLTPAQENALITHFYSYGYNETRPSKPAPVTTPDANEGKTFTLTNGIDVITGTSGDDTFLAGTQNGQNTLNAGDQLDGAAGTDKIDIYAGTANFGAASIKNIEIVNVYEDAALDVSANAGVKQAWSIGGAAKTFTATTGQVIGFGNVSTGGVSVATFQNVAGTADAATIALKDAGKTTAYTSVAVAGIENLTVDAVSGKNQLGNLIVDKAETITFKGDGSVKAAVTTTTTLKSVDATASKGGVDLALAGALFGTEIKVASGAGNDTVTFGLALGKKATIDLGDGKNTLEITQGVTAPTAGSTFKAGSGTEDTLVLATTTTAIDATTGKMFTGFETIKLTGTTSSYQTGFIAGITGYEVATSTKGTLTKLADAANVKITATGTDTVLTLADNSAATSSVKITLDNGAAGKAPAAGIVTNIDTNAHVLNVTSSGNVTATVNDITLVGDALAQVTNIAVTGNQAAEVNTGIATALTLIDGSTATGKLAIVATGATKSMTVKGGEAADNITATNDSGAVSTIVGGKGGDSITLGATAVNNKGDVVKLTAQADSTAAGFDIISNFVGGTTVPGNADFLDLKAFGFTGAQAASFTLGAAQVSTTNTGAAATFSIAASAATDFFANAGADKGVALYSTTTETFVFIDADKNGNWDAGTDSVVLLVGDYKTTDLLTATQFQFA